MANMQYVEIPYVEKPVSRIFYGTAAHPFMKGGDCNEIQYQVPRTEGGISKGGVSIMPLPIQEKRYL